MRQHFSKHVRVKVFRNLAGDELEIAINKFLEEAKTVILDIQFSAGEALVMYLKS